MSDSSQASDEHSMAKRLRLFEAGWGDAAIGEAVGRHRHTIYQWRRGIDPTARRPNPECERRTLYESGLSDQGIAIKLGLSKSTVCLWRQSRGLKSNNSNQAVTPPLIKDKRSARQAAYDRGLSDSEIAKAVGIGLRGVCKWRTKLGLPSHSTGLKPHSPRAAASLDSLPVFAALSIEQKDALIATFRLGASRREICNQIGASIKQVERIVGRLGSDVREARRLAQGQNSRTRHLRRAKYAAQSVGPSATNPLLDRLYRKIAEAIPRGIDPTLRDDMMSEAYVDFLMSEQDEGNLMSIVKAAKSRMWAFANLRGSRSLDAPFGADSDFSLADVLPDSSPTWDDALHLFPPGYRAPS